MSYPFEDSVAKFGDLIKPLSDLAETEDPFDPEFPARLPTGKAYASDLIKDRVCKYRSLHAKHKLCSADAILIGEKNSETHYYFVDFKNQKVDNIQSVKDEDRNELMQKAFDSLSILSMTFGQNVPMRAIQQHSSFIVVYPAQDYSTRFQDALNQCADNQPLWHLDRLTKSGFYSDVQTVHDGTFASMSLPYLD